MSYFLETLEKDVWARLRALTGNWLWLDMVDTGLHRAQDLPQDPSAQLSHVWGWGSNWWVRARADRDLPGGVQALMLQFASSPAEASQGEAVSVETLPFRTWATTDNEVSLRFSGQALPVQMRELLIRRHRATSSGLWVTAVSFVDDQKSDEGA